MAQKPFHWTLKFDPRVQGDIDQLTDDDFDVIMKQLHRLARRVNPANAEGVDLIHCTGDRWYRFRYCNCRVAFELKWERHFLVVRAILYRDAETYAKIEAVYEASRN